MNGNHLANSDAHDLCTHNRNGRCWRGRRRNCSWLRRGSGTENSVVERLEVQWRIAQCNALDVVVSPKICGQLHVLAFGIAADKNLQRGVRQRSLDEINNVLVGERESKGNKH